MRRSWTYETELYRYANRDDLPAFASLLNDPEVGRWLWFAPLPAQAVIDYFGPFLDRQTEQLAAGEPPPTAVFAVENLDGHFLGHGAVVAVAASPGGYEIGFQLDRVAWGRGVGTRLGQFLIAYAIEHNNAYRIEGNCLQGNRPSAGLLRKLGLHLEGVRPGYRLKGDVRHTELSFGREVSELDRNEIRKVSERTGLGCS